MAALIGALQRERSTAMSLPAPTGPFTVGRATYAFVDDDHADSLAPAPGAKREILLWLWYPAAADPSAQRDDYIPAAMLEAAQHATGVPTVGGRLMRLLTRDPSKVRSNSVPNAGVSPRQPSYPVLLMRGGASVGVTNYSTLAEDLASHGYIVAGVDAPYRTGIVVFPDGRVALRTAENNPELLLERRDVDRLKQVFAAWTDDMAFAVDRLEQLNAADTSGRFTGHLDLTRVGAFGHSFGGAQAAEFCRDDSRCKAVIDIDGAPFGDIIQTGVPKPLMFLLSDLGDFSSDAEVRQIRADIQSIYDRLPADSRVHASIRGANHFTFSDDGALLKSAAVRRALRLFGKLRIDGARQLAVTAYCVRTFFDAYLKDQRHGPVHLQSPDFPEVQLSN